MVAPTLRRLFYQASIGDHAVGDATSFAVEMKHAVAGLYSEPSAWYSAGEGPRLSAGRHRVQGHNAGGDCTFRPLYSHTRSRPQSVFY